MTKVTKPAIRTPSGKVVEGKVGKQHKDIGVKGEHVFKTDDGKTVDRKEAAKIAKVPGVKSLHSHDLPAFKARKK
jgi:hypothetical protein